ncbi:MAG: acetyl-CoA carboxylase biotin carboxyl carrier protein subunit [Bacteroidetes bacterium]|nr:MAG: acetyl-CoA carboxylase biotin carboxyl carrier protein subunit [Bacteroidota bacterium]REK03555.1 MAG: acetyl-CoA carboxylase biotin carboxyl carrier protein subunit [Bacteroidota bacterium]REK34619.1 MAG: acetyl-CoA carboxylase biotin carboxyl carrier protein subunit [Bacteroidota bacterium]REK50683.1 MAG: acetyl-CoA carboxylase biotin carboxyl carrier protein subunit [Bacteroidota bacterium]
MYKVKVNNQNFEVEVEAAGKKVNGEDFNPDILEYKEGKFHVLHKGRSFNAEIISSDLQAKTFVIRVNNNVYELSVKDKYDLLLKEMGIDVNAGKKVNDIKAPMPGLVLSVMVEDGQQIAKGDALLVLEAMKMENVLKSPSDGIIKKIQVSKGDKVEKNQVMIVIN